jgi:hypothetical protein
MPFEAATSLVRRTGAESTRAARACRALPPSITGLADCLVPPRPPTLEELP